MPPKHMSALEAPAVKTEKTETRTMDQLLALGHETLAKHAFDLQLSLAALQRPALAQIPNSAPAAPTTVAAMPTSTAGLTAREVRSKGHELRDKIYRGVKQVMKWQNSCKLGRSRFSYSSGVACEDVVLAALRLPKPNKSWKQKKISIWDFQDCVGDIVKSIRYGSLRITGQNVLVKWNPDDNTFTVSGTYGKPTVADMLAAAEAEAEVEDGGEGEAEAEAEA
ncbi:hypothetical protein B0T19DRAFT_146024 [Cercophora scortea]|uniref:Uncharacterized protein n=1 Tax=Cercophora scortea TaxID=314031 RepID=A0AAE0J0V2_9PEZI|nr:hypothetical protein B0T19DRAFT_146024 [Cercophora scortea]